MVPILETVNQIMLQADRDGDFHSGKEMADRFRAEMKPRLYETFTADELAQMVSNSMYHKIMEARAVEQAMGEVNKVLGELVKIAQADAKPQDNQPDQGKD